MAARDWVAPAILVGGVALCVGLWLRGTVTRGTAYRVVSGTNEVYAYRFVLRERLTLPVLPWSMAHPVAARHARSEVYPAVSGVIGCLAVEPTQASVGTAEARLDRAIALPLSLTVLRVARVGGPSSDPTDASTLRSDCQALSRVDPTDLTVPAVPAG